MIIGATLSATPYKIRTSQAEHFLRCGADILLNGLSRNIDGEGKCVICGTTTRLKMSEGRLQELDPETPFSTWSRFLKNRARSELNVRSPISSTPKNAS